MIRLRQDGPLAVWGAGAKGVAFLNVLDPDASLVETVIDINPRKQGGFVPGTGHPIHGVDGLREAGTSSVLVMNPGYAAECRGMALDRVGHVRVLDIDDLLGGST